MVEINKENYVVDCHDFHSELLEIETNTVWQSHRPMTRDALDNLELPYGIIKVGMGIIKAGVSRGTMDSTYFRRSPGALADGPLAVKTISGHLFFHCANAPDNAERPFPGGPTLVRIDKFQSLVFEPGRRVDLFCLPDGREYVQVIAATSEGGGIIQSKESTRSELIVPESLSIRTEEIEACISIHLPNPSESWFFDNGSSFQGPVEDFKHS